MAPTGETAAKSPTEGDEVICQNCGIELANLKNTMFGAIIHLRDKLSGEGIEAP